MYTINIITIHINATDLGSLEAVATCQRGKPTSAENEARYLREQTGTSVPGRPSVVGRRRKITSPE